MKSSKKILFPALILIMSLCLTSCAEPVTVKAMYKGDGGTISLQPITLTLSGTSESVNLELSSVSECVTIYSDNEWIETASAIFSYSYANAGASSPSTCTVQISGIFAKGDVQKDESTDSITNLTTTASYKINETDLTEKLQNQWVKNGVLTLKDIKFNTVVSSPSDLYSVSYTDDEVTGALGGKLVK